MRWGRRAPEHWRRDRRSSSCTQDVQRCKHEEAVMDELDSYSRTVSAVAAELTGRVAAVRTGRGSGSAVVVPGDGILVTNAHVVGEARSGRADFLDGTQTGVTVVGTDPLS